MHLILIGLHAAAGVVALAACCVAVRRGGYFAVYFWSLVALVAFLAAVVAVDWGALDPASRGIFAAFTALGGYMIWRAVLARRILAAGTASTSARYLGHVGFTLVGLLDGFAVIAVLDLGAPVWAVVAVGVLIAVTGHLAIRRARARRISRSEAVAGGGERSVRSRV